MSMCPYCGRVFDESEDWPCPYCGGRGRTRRSSQILADEIEV